ncbi:MAG: tetratricopeptide repeat protein, partial [Planctomycetia bacterium]
REDDLTEKLESLRKKFPEHVPLLCFLGQHYFEKKKYDQAKEAFLTSLKFQPTRTALTGIGEVGLQADDPTPWLGFMARQFELCGSVTTLDEQVDRVARDPKLLDQTLKAAERILHDTPDRLGKYGPLATAVIALRGKRFEQIEKLLPSVEKSTPEETNQLLLCWAMLLFEENQYSEAVQVLQKGLKRGAKKEEYVSLEYLLAAALEMQGKTDRAIRAIDRAIAHDPASARLGYQKAWILFHAKRYKEARNALEAFLAKHQKTYDKLPTRFLVADARQMLAHLVALANEVDEAQEQLLTVLDEFPDDTSAKNDLAFLWAERGVNLQKSLRLATDAVRADPKNGLYRDTLGWVYFRLGQNRRAAQELRQAVKLAPENKEISDHLHRVLELSKKTD